MRKFFETALLNPITFEAVYSIRVGLSHQSSALIYSEPFDPKAEPKSIVEKLTIINTYLRRLGQELMTGDEVKKFVDPMNISESREYTTEELSKLAGITQEV